MKNEWKKWIALLKYGHRFRFQFILALCFFAGGLAMQIGSVYFAASAVLTGTDSEAAFFLQSLSIGTLLTVCAAAMPAQILLSLDVSLLAQASPYKKRLQSGIFTTVSCTLSLICLTILLIIVRTAAAAVPVIRNYLSQGFLISGFIAAAMLICWPIMYKYYMASLAIIFSAAFLGGMSSVLLIVAEGDTIAILDYHLPSSPLVCILLAYIAVLAASAVSHIITQALYKKPFSKHVFGIMMKEL
ncbi:MAG: hypothetical protein LUB60_04855 [Clostridiales bacterium]|nr:hypothetical protein [Clostridiales bacterium]